MARHCTLAGMKLWADSDEVTPGYWFRAEPGAEVIQGESPFRKHSTWDRELKWDGTGEQTLTPAPYYKGQNPLGYDGKVHCGGDEWLKTGGVHGRDEELETDDVGSLPCCFGGLEPLPEIAEVFHLNAYNTSSTSGEILRAHPFPNPPAGTLAVLAFDHFGFGAVSTASVPGWTKLTEIVYGGGSGRVSAWWRLIDGSELWPMPVAFTGVFAMGGYGFAFDPAGATNVSVAIEERPTGAIIWDGTFPAAVECYGVLIGIVSNGSQPGWDDPLGWGTRGANAASGSHLSLAAWARAEAPGRLHPLTHPAGTFGKIWAVTFTLTRP